MYLYKAGCFSLPKDTSLCSSDDVMTRAMALYDNLSAVIKDYKRDVNVVTYEAISHVPNSSSMARIAASFGVIASLIAHSKTKSYGYSPMEIKQVVCGNKSASKEDVMESVFTRFPEGISILSENTKKSLWNHSCDAIGSTITWFDKDS